MSMPPNGAGEGEPIATRTYTAVFHDVWVATLGAAGALRGWSVNVADPRAGTATLATADLLGRSPAVVEVRLSLDAVGLTLLEVRLPATQSPERARDARRARRLLRRVDRLLEATSRR